MAAEPGLGVVIPNIILQIQSRCNHAIFSHFSLQTTLFEIEENHAKACLSANSPKQTNGIKI